MANYDKLKAAGVDVDDLLKRLMGNQSLVPIFIRKFTEDKSYEELLAAFKAKDMKQAEMASHTLKGICGNLSITALFALFTEQVNLIRSGDYDKAESMMAEISSIYRHTIDSMKEWLTQ